MILVQNPPAPDKAGLERSSTGDAPLRGSFAIDGDGAVPLRLREPSLLFAKPDPPAGSRRDFNAAIGLVEKASEAIDSLQTRCRQLQREVNDLRARSKLEVEAAESLAAEWQKLARTAKTQLEDCETRLALMKQKFHETEARAELAKERLEALQHMALEDAEQSARFHDKIVSAFGVGSRVHAALDSLED